MQKEDEQDGWASAGLDLDSISEATTTDGRSIDLFGDEEDRTEQQTKTRRKQQRAKQTDDVDVEEVVAEMLRTKLGRATIGSAFLASAYFMRPDLEAVAGLGLVGLLFIATSVIPFMIGESDNKQNDTFVAKTRSLLSNIDTSRSTDGSIPAAVDREIKNRAGGHCEYCRRPTTHLDRHHIRPKNEGGAHRPENLIMLCGVCHDEADAGDIQRRDLRSRIAKSTK